jgi:ABC-2 type transport system permease protein
MRTRSGTRRGSAIFSVVTGLIFYGFWSFAAWGAMLFFTDPEQSIYFLPVLSSGMMFVMLYWQLTPVISASFGASLDLRKLLVYPIPHSKLFLVEILLRVTTCAEMLLVLGGVVIGLLRNPLYGWRQAPVILTGAIFYTAMNVLLSAGVRNWLERLILRTKLKEVMILLLVVAGFAPQMLIYMRVKKASVLHFVPSQVIWPWAAMARLMLHDPVVLSALSATLWLAASAWFSRRQFERGIRYDAAPLARRPERESRTDGIAERLFRFPSRFLGDPVAALLEKELRTFVRIPRFRLVYAMSCFFGLLLYFPTLRNPHHDTFFQQNALPLMSLYGLLMLGQISYWNSFGFDRSAVQGYFCWPIRFRDVLVAKNLTVLCLLIPQILLISIVGRLAHLPTGPGKVFETIIVIMIASLYWLSVGNICSVRLPRALDPDKMNQMSNKMQAALTVWAAPFLLLPLALAYWSRWFFSSQLAFVAIMMVAAIIGAIVYWVGLDSAVTTAYQRRESILMQLSRSDGPVSIT